MAPNAPAVFDREGGHTLLTPARAILHQSPADVPLCKLPSTGEVRDPEAHIRFGVEEPCDASLVAQHSSRPETDLHEPHLTHPSRHAGVEPALDLRNRIRQRGRKATLFGGASNKGEISAAGFRISRGKADQALDGWG